MRNETDTRNDGRDTRYIAAENALRMALQRAASQSRVNPEPVRAVATVATPEPVTVAVAEPVIVATVPASAEPVRAEPVSARSARTSSFTSATQITFTKLRNGDWGLRGPEAALHAAQWVTVSLRAGGTSRKQVGRVVWSGDGVAVATIQR